MCVCVLCVCTCVCVYCHRYAEMPIHRLTIHELLSAGSHITDERIVSMAQHVQREICTRLARRLLDIQTLPYIVVENPHIQTVHKLYRTAFEKLVAFPKVVNITQDAMFVNTLKDLVQEGVQVVPLLARGTYESSLKVSAKRLNCVKFLADMVMSRISRRVIAEQFIALHTAREGYVGIICKDLSVLKVVERVSPEAALTCERTYGLSPHIEIEGDASITCSYIPTHLEYIIFELLKNAMRAVCERHLLPSSSRSSASATSSGLFNTPTPSSFVSDAVELRALRSPCPARCVESTVNPSPLPYPPKLATPCHSGLHVQHVVAVLADNVKFPTPSLAT
jgi:hypothetical protein